MTMPDLCETCYGVHQGIPECVGRPQTDREWMLDRGVRPERADEILAARSLYSADTGHKYPAMAQPPKQETLF